MGICWSVGGKRFSPSHTGVNSKLDRNDQSNWSNKAFSMPPTSQSDILQSDIKSFSFDELKLATRNFHPDCVQGGCGFGYIVKGWIDEHSYAPAKPGTGMVIAVKILNLGNLDGDKEWLAEVKYIGQLNHPNLVKLIGYCLEDDHFVLVHEFVPRGSFVNHLFRRDSQFKPLCWGLRMKIVLGAAKGLAFLHNANVIYRNFNTSNILLDLGYNVKLSDFGLVVDGPTAVLSHAAPEYITVGHLTAKSDVYSFGVVLLEMLSGQRAVDKSRSSQQHLVEWAKPYLSSKRKMFQVVDTLMEGYYTLGGVQKVANLALHCLSAQPKSRPNMAEVVSTLEQLQ